MPENLPSGGKLRAYRRVVLADGVLVHASDELSAIGYISTEGISYGDGQPVHLREPGGAALVAIDGECQDGDELFAAADGKVSATGDVLEGVAVGESENGLVRLRWSDEPTELEVPDKWMQNK